MTFTGGFDYLGWLLGVVRKPKLWIGMGQSQRQDFAEMFGCTTDELNHLIVKLYVRGSSGSYESYRLLGGDKYDDVVTSS